MILPEAIDDGLFPVSPDAIAGNLRDRFVAPPFSVLDRMSGEWKARVQAWKAAGIGAELDGREENLLNYKRVEGSYTAHQFNTYSGTSIFDPVLAEVAYAWFTAPGASILDPFAGGDVRGIVAGILGRPYVGIDLREEQLEANERSRASLAGLLLEEPRWLLGDSQDMDELPVPDEFDFIFSCPPYADLERYCDDPRDISNMSPEAFSEAYAWIIGSACARLRDDRFAGWVISDVRDKRGFYRGIVHETIRAFAEAGLGLYNDLIIVGPAATAAVRAGYMFTRGRKTVRIHQHMLIFAKGNPRAAADWASQEEAT